MKPRDHLWAVVLAAGEGRRVSAWTADARGAVPKQYYSFGGPRAMVHWALDRARGVVAPGHVVVVVAEEHRRFWSRELAALPPPNIVVQPRNRGTAPGILLPLLTICDRDRKARVIVLPSDHYVARERILRTALLRATRVPPEGEGRVTLLGMTPTDLDPEYGWIVPDPSHSDGRVSGFMEKPDRETAAGLMTVGALLSTLMLVADADALLRLYEEALPELFRSFLDRSNGNRQACEDLYETIRDADFSRDVLARFADRLSLLQVPDCGWSDLGTPARVKRFLDRQQAVRRGVTPPRACLTPLSHSFTSI
jgi:mannose-1-phosphate guanylyltransferase